MACTVSPISLQTRLPLFGKFLPSTNIQEFLVSLLLNNVATKIQKPNYVMIVARVSSCFGSFSN